MGCRKVVVARTSSHPDVIEYVVSPEALELPVLLLCLIGMMVMVLTTVLGDTPRFEDFGFPGAVFVVVDSVPALFCVAVLWTLAVMVFALYWILGMFRTWQHHVSGAISTCLALFMYFSQIIVIFAWAVFTAFLSVKPGTTDMMGLLLPYIIFLVAFAWWCVCSALEVAFYPSDIPVPRKVVHNLLIFLFMLVSLAIAAFLCMTIITGGEHTPAESAASSTLLSNATTVALDIVVNGTYAAPQLLSASRALVVHPVTLQVMFILNLAWLAFLLIMPLLPCYCKRYPIVYRAYAGALETSRNDDDDAGRPNSVCLDLTPPSQEKDEDAPASHEPLTQHDDDDHEDAPAASQDGEEQE